MPGAARSLAAGQEVLGQPGVKRQTPVTSAKGADPALTLTLAAPRQVKLALGEPTERAWGLGRPPEHPRGWVRRAPPPRRPLAVLCLHLPFQLTCVKSEGRSVPGCCLEFLCPLGCLARGGGGGREESLGLQPPPGGRHPSPSLLRMLPPGPDGGGSVGWPGESVSHTDTPPPPLSKAHCAVGPSAWRDEFQRRGWEKPWER